MTIFRNVVNHTLNHKASHPRTHESSATLLRHSRMSHIYVRQKNSWKRLTELLQKSEGRTHLPSRPSNLLSMLRLLVNQRINYSTMQLSITLHLYNSHHHTPIRLSNPTTTLSVNCRYFSRSIGWRNIARRPLPFWCLQYNLPGRAVPNVTLVMVNYDRRSGVWRLSYEVCQVHTNKRTHIL